MSSSKSQPQQVYLVEVDLLGQSAPKLEQPNATDQSNRTLKAVAALRQYLSEKGGNPK